jgi:hypothetical protein
LCVAFIVSVRGLQERHQLGVVEVGLFFFRVSFAVGHEGKHDVAWRRGGPQNAWVGKSPFKSPREVFSDASLQERHQLGVVEVGLFFFGFLCRRTRRKT